MKDCENYRNMAQKQEVSKCYWKNLLGRLAWLRLATDFPCVKKKWCLGGTVKQNTVRQGMPVLVFQGWSNVTFLEKVLNNFVQLDCLPKQLSCRYQNCLYVLMTFTTFYYLRLWIFFFLVRNTESWVRWSPAKWKAAEAQSGPSAGTPF